MECIQGMKNIKLLIEYDGTNYSGWQRQTNALSVQQVLEEALFKLTGENVTVIGSGGLTAEYTPEDRWLIFLPPLQFLLTGSAML